MASGLLPRPGQVRELISCSLKILLLCDTENSLVKRVRNELLARKVKLNWHLIYLFGPINVYDHMLVLFQYIELYCIFHLFFCFVGFKGFFFSRNNCKLLCASVNYKRIHESKTTASLYFCRFAATLLLSVMSFLRCSVHNKTFLPYQCLMDSTVYITVG